MVAKKIKSIGLHLIIELCECKNKKLLTDVSEVERVMIAATKAAKATVIDSVFHRFQPCGVSGIVVIAESHLSIHTWPEYKYAAVDVFTCGNSTNPQKAFEVLKKEFKSRRFNVMKVERSISN
jgi:S-adenosylmethionine decarboxylase proenzyme